MAAVLLLPQRIVSLPSPPQVSPRAAADQFFSLRSLPSAAAAAQGLRAAGDRPGAGLADQTTVYNGVYGPWTSRGLRRPRGVACTGRGW
ncbi:hypothetical protein PR202_gb10243 [Eleusine coracana subsp. coracana]|uniref:Uncharacterized protein n=1 Tax=Eleusine coracana subsp. coracana TaxID=191504 RepID=A0AAV5EJ14_ELECO|nr:hypothetical protein PR202_gb10243 [Eleusine coracana subsp. coracana]